MTSHVLRLYALVAGTVIFFVTWVAVAAHPWATATPRTDPRLSALAAREQRLRAESVRVQKIVELRFARYRRELRARRSEITRVLAQQARERVVASAQAASVAAPPAPATAPAVQIVHLPPLVVTRTS
jgi:hypothetical protein